MSYHFDEQAANRPIYFTEKYCKHFNGELAGEPFILTDWQKNDIVRPAFGWKDEQGRRKHRYVYVELPKGNGKSALLSAICLYVACYDNATNAEIYCVAGDRFQAKIIFDAAKQMVQASKELTKACEIRRDHIKHRKSGSKIMVISADAKRQHGFRPYFIAFDELHVQPNRELYDTLTRGLMKLWNSMCFMITTAGVKNTFAESIHDYALQIKNGTTINPAWHAVIYNADEEDDPFDEATWRKANPGLNTGIIDPDNFRILAQDARIPSALNAFKQLHLNIWTGSVQAWIPPHTWKLCQGVLPDDEYLAGLDCFVGFDKSSTTDLTCIACLYIDSTNEMYYLRVYTFVPNATVYDRTKRENINYLAWVDQGWIETTEGNTQDDEAIINRIIEISQNNNVKLVGYDPWGAATIAAKLYSDHDIEVLKVSQMLSVLSEPSKWFERMVCDGILMDNSNPVFAWALDNTNIYKDSNDNYRPHKGKSKGRIDPVIATVNACAAYLHWLKENEDLNFLNGGISYI